MIPYALTVADAAAPEASLHFTFYGGVVSAAGNCSLHNWGLLGVSREGLTTTQEGEMGLKIDCPVDLTRTPFMGVSFTAIYTGNMCRGYRNESIPCNDTGQPVIDWSSQSQIGWQSRKSTRLAVGRDSTASWPTNRVKSVWSVREIDTDVP